jgi:methyl-accepting chemotaxis protein
MNKHIEGIGPGILRSLMLPFCVGIAIVLMTAIAGYSQSATPDANLDSSEKAAMRELREIAEVTANLVNVYMDARVTDMLVCSTTCTPLGEALTTPDARGEANRVLAEWLKASGAYDAIVLLDKAGACVASAPEALVNRDFSSDEAFKGAAKGKLTISDFHKSDVLASLNPKSEGRAATLAGWTIAIAVPIKAGNDLEGVLVSYLKWSRLAQLIAAIRVGESGYVYVLNGQNQIIIHPASHLYGENIRGPKINLPALDDAVKKKVPHFRYTFANARTGKPDTKFVGFAYPAGYGNFPGLGWTVGAAADEWEIVGGHPLLRSLMKLFQ